MRWSLQYQKNTSVLHWCVFEPRFVSLTLAFNDDQQHTVSLTPGTSATATFQVGRDAVAGILTTH